ncbi:hypothetical protein OH77DRAFT_1032609 [Trametes cingulata]|nr:hypothetical protein OH77DRAFT_1032609 [Trametes cingulata]
MQGKRHQPEAFRVSANLMTMRADLIRIFHESALAVGLPERLRSPRQEWDEFLREHFLFTLIAGVTRGDIREDYDPARVQLFKESMGLDTMEGSCDLDLSDPAWTTPIGVEVLEHELARKAKMPPAYLWSRHCCESE